MNTVMVIIAVMSFVGLLFGLILAYANKKLAMEMNPLIHLVEEVLPKGQCGSCGYAGCQSYAEAVVLDKDVPPNLCLPGKKTVAGRVAELTGKAAAEVEPRVAYVKCTNPIVTSGKKYIYSGIQDCLAASLLHAGAKDCEYGCLGLGTCVRKCVFDALELNELGLPVVNREKCTGCGSCAAACPKQVIAMIPDDALVAVACSSHDKGAAARKYCSTACIGCGICQKQCPHGAIKIEEYLAVVDDDICKKECQSPVCLEKCPTKAIRESLPALLTSKAV